MLISKNNNTPKHNEKNLYSVLHIMLDDDEVSEQTKRPVVSTLTGSCGVIGLYSFVVVM